MTIDDRFDELLQEAAREHNSAPDTPRAEMWAAIAAARGASARGATRAARGAGEVTSPASGEATGEGRDARVRVLPFARRHRRTLALVAALAATLVIGVVIGRRTAAERADAILAPAVAQLIHPTVSGASQLGAPDAPSSGTGPVILSPIGPSIATPRGGARDRALPNAREGVARTAAGGASEAPLHRHDANSSEATLPYRVATMQHLVATEALLVALRSDARAGRRDTTIATWAGDLLGTTRMLIDSPAAKDRQLKQLLEDLELVLAQISRLPGAHGEAADLGIIDDAVRHRQIMTRLRALSPET